MQSPQWKILTPNYTMSNRQYEQVIYNLRLYIIVVSFIWHIAHTLELTAHLKVSFIDTTHDGHSLYTGYRPWFLSLFPVRIRRIILLV